MKTPADPEIVKSETTGVVSIPCRYVHSPAEVIDMKDLQSVAKLMAEFVLRLPARPKFVPF